MLWTPQQPEYKNSCRRALTTHCRVPRPIIGNFVGFLVKKTARNWCEHARKCVHMLCVEKNNRSDWACSFWTRSPLGADPRACQAVPTQTCQQTRCYASLPKLHWNLMTVLKKYIRLSTPKVSPLDGIGLDLGSGLEEYFGGVLWVSSLGYDQGGGQ